MTTLVKELSRWVVPLMLLIIPLAAFTKRVKVYEVFIEGAQQGFTTAVRIIPYLVAMLVGISVFRASGAMELLADLLTPLLRPLGIPAQVLPLAFMRPLSGSGALGLATELIKVYGPDSLIGRLASTMQGSADTTFYVLTVYFGSVGIKRYRYAMAVGLIADITAFFASVWIVHKVFG
ncbi:MAG TPA: spore maturation protein [Bacillota bacterium]|nr:spore maturation protein [Bacillota bacterium]